MKKIGVSSLSAPNGSKPMPRPQPSAPPQGMSTPPRARVTGFVDSEVPETVQPAVSKSFVKDGRHVLLGEPPSNYLGYDFKELWIRRFAVNEATLVFMAKKSENLMYLKSAVGACLNVDIDKLYVFDFEYCLYWLRMNSYPKKPVTVSWECDAEIASSEPDGEPTICGNETLSTITMTDIKTNNLPANLVIPEGVSIPTMALFEGVWKINQKLAPLQKAFNNGWPHDEELRIQLEADAYTATLAQWVDEGETLEDKIEILMSQPDLELQSSIEEFSELLDEVGVSEYIEVTCSKCGGPSRRRVDINYLSFFP